MFARFRNTNPIGRRGERIAARWLRKHRYRVIGRNVHVGVGEADIVCLAPDRRTLVIVEVKSRRLGERDQPMPEASVGAHKQRKLRLVAQAIAKSSGMEDRPLRIDVIGVDLPARGRAVVRHHESAVGG
jgi:putative endonuclease